MWSYIWKGKEQKHSKGSRVGWVKMDFKVETEIKEKIWLFEASKCHEWKWSNVGLDLCVRNLLRVVVAVVWLFLFWLLMWSEFCTCPAWFSWHAAPRARCLERQATWCCWCRFPLDTPCVSVNGSVFTRLSTTSAVWGWANEWEH